MHNSISNNYVDLCQKGAAKTSDYVNPPKCKCGKPMNLCELQHCYSLRTGPITCQECKIEMNENTTLTWHCINAHDYKYDVCIDCVEILSEKDEKENKNESNTDKYNVFDKKYNIKNEINWNDLYKLMHDDGKILVVIKIINKYISTHNNYQKMLPKDLLKFIATCQKKAKLAQECHNRLWRHDDWTIVVDNVENISIWYRKEQDSDIHSLKTKVTMNCTPLDIICILNEIDLLPELISLIKVETKFVKEVSIVKKIIYGKGHLWFPFKNRDILASVEAFDLLDDYGEILLCGQSIDDISPATNPDSQTVRIEAKHSEGVIKPIKFGENNNLSQIITITNVDPKSYIPTSLLNWVIRSFAFYAIKMIRNRCENLKGTKHARRIATKTIYRKWKKDMIEYVNKHGM